MAIKPLPSQEYLRQILDYNEVTGIFTWRWRETAKREWNTRYAGKTAGSSLSVGGYRHISIKKTFHYEHRLAWLYIYGAPLPPTIDHINLNKSDNRICNLRAATQSQNNCNRRAINNKTGFKGVSIHQKSGKFVAYIRTEKGKKNLGYFSTPEEAHSAYCEAANQYHGEYARGA